MRFVNKNFALIYLLMALLFHTESRAKNIQEKKQIVSTKQKITEQNNQQTKKPVEIKSHKIKEKKDQQPQSQATNNGFFSKPHSLFLGNLDYVSPMGVKDFRSNPSRLNFYADIYGGPGVAFGHPAADERNGTPTYNQQTIGSLGFSLGFEMVIKKFYFSFGVGEYTLFSSQEFNQSSGFDYVTVGYKFQFAIGGQITIPKVPLITIYLLYRDNQLQRNNQGYLDYYSRNIGLGAFVNVYKGISLGMDVVFSLLHHDFTFTNIGPYGSGFPLVMPQFFVRFAF